MVHNDTHEHWRVPNRAERVISVQVRVGSATLHLCPGVISVGAD